MQKVKSYFTKKDEDRETWNNHLEFILACIGYSVGLGNVWRFPTVCYENGGGAFLIPYLITLILIGKPMYLMELAMGQFTRQGPPGCFNFAPIAKGCGWGMIIVSLNVAIYYNVLMAATVHYMFGAMQKEMPWTHCNNGFNSPQCQPFNYTYTETKRLPNSTFPTQEYWERKVTRIYDSTGIGNLGKLNVEFSLCLLFSWLIVFAIVFKGVKSTGKVVYATATLPYVLLILLLIKGLTLKGSQTGIYYFIKPHFKKILNPTVWQRAVGQMFFSLSVSFGGIMTYASFISFNNNCYRDTLIVTVLDTFTSLVAGFVIFSVLGYMAHLKHSTIDTVISSGPGLAFIVYPEALSHIPWANMWSVLFFFMLWTLGIDSQIAFIETVQTALHDQFPQTFPRSRKTLICASLCIFGFLAGLPCVTRGGMYVLDIMDHYGSNVCMIFIAIFELISISWIYGYQRFTDDISYMLGYKLPQAKLWQFSWAIFAPITLIIICISYFIQSVFFDQRFRSGSYIFPVWAQFIGYCLFLAVVLQVPIWACIRIYKTKNDESFKKKLMNALKPSESFEKIRPVPQYSIDGFTSPFSQVASLSSSSN